MLSDLSQRATLQTRVLASDGGGGSIEGWHTIGAAWVDITPLAATERFGGDRSAMRIRHRIKMRARDDVVSGMRILVGARNFAIRAVLDRSTDNRFLTVMCEEQP